MEQYITLDVLMADNRRCHSDFQMDYFITSRAGGRTLYGQYKQALRELHKRMRALESVEYEQAELQCDAEDLRSRWCFTARARRRRNLKLRMLRAREEDLRARRKDTWRELDRFLWQCRRFKEQLGDLPEPRRAALERQLWADRIRVRAGLEKIAGDAYSMETLEMLLALPPAMRMKMIEELNRPQDLVDRLQVDDGPHYLLEDGDERGGRHVDSL